MEIREGLLLYAWFNKSDYLLMNFSFQENSCS